MGVSHELPHSLGPGPGSGIRETWHRPLAGTTVEVELAVATRADDRSPHLARVLARAQALIGGGRPFETPWSKGQQLRSKEVEEMQRRLTALGLYHDKMDGKAGMLTRAALGSPVRDLATTRQGELGYRLARLVPRRLLDRVTTARMRAGDGAHQ